MLRLFIVVAFIFYAANALAAEDDDVWPKMYGAGKHCDDAFEIAKSAFFSDSFNMHTAPIPPNANSKLILGYYVGENGDNDYYRHSEAILFSQIRM